MSTETIDAGRLSLALADLRLPAIKLVWPDLAARADKEAWPAARFLAALAEHELAERAQVAPRRRPRPRPGRERLARAVHPHH